MEKLLKRYLALPQDIRFGIPVVLGMMIFGLICIALLSKPQTCKDAREISEQLMNQQEDGTLTQSNARRDALIRADRICSRRSN